MLKLFILFLCCCSNAHAMMQEQLLSHNDDTIASNNASTIGNAASQQRTSMLTANTLLLLQLATSAIQLTNRTARTQSNVPIDANSGADAVLVESDSSTNSPVSAHYRLLPSPTLDSQHKHRPC